MPVVRLIPLRLHALSDALVLVIAFLTPWIWGFAGYNWPSLFVWGIVAVAMLLNLGSQYPLGIVRFVPMKVHSLLEYAAAPAFLILPPYLFADVPGLPVVIPILGAINLLTNLLTDYPTAAGRAPA